MTEASREETTTLRPYRRFDAVQCVAEQWCMEWICDGETDSLKCVELMMKWAPKGLYSREEMIQHFSDDLYSYTSYSIAGTQIETPKGIIDVHLLDCNGRWYFIARMEGENNSTSVVSDAGRRNPTQTKEGNK